MTAQAALGKACGLGDTPGGIPGSYVNSAIPIPDCAGLVLVAFGFSWTCNEAGGAGSAVRPRRDEQRPALRWCEALDSVADGRPRNPRAVRAQIALQPPRIHFAGLAQRPPDRLLNQVGFIAVQHACSRVDVVEQVVLSEWRNQRDDGGAAHPQIAI